jgi:hypothetical protein
MSTTRPPWKVWDGIPVRDQHFWQIVQERVTSIATAMAREGASRDTQIGVLGRLGATGQQIITALQDGDLADGEDAEAIARRAMNTRAHGND